jgi:OOP family OmpA-OmpF porin
VVEHQLIIHLNATAVLFDRVAVNLDMPFSLFQSGEGSVEEGDIQLTSPDGPAIGDLRIGARVRLFGEYHDPFQIALGGYVWVPVGSEDAYVTDGSVRGYPHAIVGGRADRFIWSFSAGPSSAAPRSSVTRPPATSSCGAPGSAACCWKIAASRSASSRRAA